MDAKNTIAEVMSGYGALWALLTLLKFQRII